MILTTLYKIDSREGIRVWECEVHDLGSYSQIVIAHGTKGGKLQEKVTKISKGKNIGKANETSHNEQAILEATSKWKKQVDKGYSITPQKVFLPMLAQDYSKHKKKISFPCYVQPKFDGCLSGESLIKTKEYGLLTISDIVDNKKDCSVLSFNISKNKKEYKKVLSYFKNREINENIEWYKIKLEDGRILELTGNHRVYLPDLGCWRRVDELDINQNLMISEK